MVNAALLDAHGEKTLALIFDKGDEMVAELTAFAKREKLGGSHHTAIGAFSDVTLGYFDLERRELPPGAAEV